MTVEKISNLPFEWFLGLRYTRAKRRNHFISFICVIAILGIALGVAALIVVMSVMNGFQSELRERILGVVSHIQISAMDGRLPEWQRIQKSALEHKEVLAAAPFVQSQVMVSAARARGALVRGILPDLEEGVAKFGESMKKGEYAALKEGSFGVILGEDLARALGVDLGDSVMMIAPDADISIVGILPRMKRFNVVGIFSVGMYEYDSGLVLMHLNDAQVFFKMNDDVSGVRLKTRDLFRAPAIVLDLAEMLNARAWLTDWTQSHANFFRAVQIEKTMMFVILSLIVAVAAFNLVSTLVMAVTDKESDIAILQTLGATPRSIMMIFIIQGAILGIFGLALGVAGGVLLATNIDVVVPFIENLFGVQFLSKEVYYISDLPSELHWSDVFGVAAMALFLAFAATLYPSYRALKIKPAEALRYE